MITIEDLRVKLEVYDRQEEERKENSGLIGKMKATVNNVLYKSKYEDVT